MSGKTAYIITIWWS